MHLLFLNFFESCQIMLFKVGEMQFTVSHFYWPQDSYEHQKKLWLNGQNLPDHS